MTAPDSRPVIIPDMTQFNRELEEIRRALAEMIRILNHLEGSGVRDGRGDPCGDQPLPPGSVT